MLFALVKVVQFIRGSQTKSFSKTSGINLRLAEN